MFFYLFSDVYEKRLDSASPDNLELLKKLRTRVEEEEKLTLELASLGGAIRMLLAASADIDSQVQPSLPPSNHNQQRLVSPTNHKTLISNHS